MRIRHFGFILMLILSLLAAAGASTTHRRHTAARRTTPSARRAAAVREFNASRSANTRRLRRVKWNPLFAGSHEMLVRQNEQLDELEMPRIQDEDELLAREQAHELVPVQDTRSLVVADNLADSHRYCKPWTRDFLEDLGDAYYEQFHEPIVATSLVRTAQQQRKLRRHIRGAAPEAGETASTHLTGVTVDILKRGMTPRQHEWLEEYLLPLKDAGLIEPIEERRQPVFHIVVFNGYDPRPEPADTYSGLRQNSSGALQAVEALDVLESLQATPPHARMSGN